MDRPPQRLSVKFIPAFSPLEKSQLAQTAQEERAGGGRLLVHVEMWFVVFCLLEAFMFYQIACRGAFGE